jgi:hypothetical protein
METLPAALSLCSIMAHCKEALPGFEPEIELSEIGEERSMAFIWAVSGMAN